MQVDIFLLRRGLESRTTCSQTFLQNVSVDSYCEWMYNLNRAAAEVQWTANSFADILYHLSSVKIRIMQISPSRHVMSR